MNMTKGSSLYLVIGVVMVMVIGSVTTLAIYAPTTATLAGGAMIAFAAQMLTALLALSKANETSMKSDVLAASVNGVVKQPVPAALRVGICRLRRVQHAKALLAGQRVHEHRNTPAQAAGWRNRRGDWHTRDQTAN